MDDMGPQMTSEGNEDDDLTAVDRLVIAHWRALGYVIPAPELSKKDRDEMTKELKQALQDFDNAMRRLGPCLNDN